ncbi:MAG TPA: thymidylate synthase [Patescibacteria group bacterium]|nr:thymidylate synthase [Patescibacteria group bacterium]
MPIDLKNWPLFYKDVLKVKDPKHHLAVCCLWTERQAVEGLLKDVPYNTIGNLYSAQGINAMLRNIFANPHIRVILIWGAEMSLSGHSLLMFSQKGIDTNRKIIAARGEIENEIPDDIIKEFQEMVAVVDMRGRSAVDFVAKANELSAKSIEPFAKRSREFPRSEPVVRLLPSEQTGFRVSSPKVAKTWLKLLNEISKYGRPKHTRYSKDNSLKEILNLTAVVTDEDPNDIYFPEYLPFARVELEAYYAEIMTSRQIPGVAYNYGKRLRLDLGVDQIAKMKELLKNRPDSKKMVAITIDPVRDWGEVNNGDTPCLVMILGSVQDDKFFLTCHFRSQDMVHGWPRNTFALRKLQKEIADSADMKMGPLTMITHSAHMYADDFGLVDDLLMKHYEGELGFTPQVHFDFDSRGNAIVEMINEADAQSYPYWSRRYETQAVPMAIERMMKKVPKGKLIRATIFEPNGGPAIKMFEGRTAQEVAWQITDWNYLTIPGHLMYVGLELQKCEEAIKNGTSYEQDPA